MSDEGHNGPEPWRMRTAALDQFPNYGAEGCRCGAIATPAMDCPLHFAIAEMERMEDATRHALAPRVDEIDRLRTENHRLRNLYENVVGNRETFGWTIDHLLECEEALRTVETAAARLEADNARLRRILDHPDPHDFARASEIEARYQMDLWGTNDGFPTAFDGTEDHHFVYLVAYLTGKVAATPDGDLEKKLHRITTIAAAAMNWHMIVSGRSS